MIIILQAKEDGFMEVEHMDVTNDRLLEVLEPGKV